jgi:glucose/galactose transporter
MLIIGGLFFIFGFITWLNGALVPFLQIVCDLTEFEALLIAFSFYIAYTVMALPMSFILDKTGYKNGMSLGLIVMAFGCLVFIPAAYGQTFSLFLFAQFLVGTGLTILQTASNPYVVKIGPEDTAAMRISIMGILNKTAGVIAPIVFTKLVLGEFSGVSAQSVALLDDAARAEKVSMLSDGLVLPYIGMAISLILLGGLLKLSKLPALNLDSDASLNASTGKDSIRNHPALLLGAISLFFYVGAEVIAGDTIGLFGSQLGLASATSFTAYTMAFMVLGYIIGLVLIGLRLVTQAQILSLSALLGIVFTIFIVTSSTNAYGLSEILWSWMNIPTLPNTITFVALLGLANAMVWPAIWPLALRNLGSLTARGSALLIMGISGGAILPLLFAKVAEHVGMQSAYLLLIPCYVFILFYAFKGHKLPIKKDQRTTQSNF